MKNGSLGILVPLLLILSVIGIGVALSNNDNSTDKHTSTSSSTSNNTSNNTSYNTSNNTKSNGGGYRSSYWYDDSATAKRKADDTLKKYYDVDKDGHILGPKEGTIRNGKPYKKTK